MKEALLQLFSEHAQLAIVISLLASILVAVLGVVPSLFITAANILFFGFWKGTAISFAGEAIGAVIAFWLYRKGFKRSIGAPLDKLPKAQRLITAEGREAFLLILSMRLLPFIPSGLVTFAAAMGKVSLPLFFIASSLGKAPALLLEAYSAYQVTAFGTQGKIILGICAIVLLFFVITRITGKSKPSN